MTTTKYAQNKKTYALDAEILRIRQIESALQNELKSTQSLLYYLDAIVGYSPEIRSEVSKLQAQISAKVTAHIDRLTKG